jgi:hypothetical protein
LTNFFIRNHISVSPSTNNFIEPVDWLVQNWIWLSFQ